MKTLNPCGVRLSQQQPQLGLVRVQLVQQLLLPLLPLSQKANCQTATAATAAKKMQKARETENVLQGASDKEFNLMRFGAFGQLNRKANSSLLQIQMQLQLRIHISDVTALQIFITCHIGELSRTENKTKTKIK